MNYLVKPFDELTIQEFYKIIQARIAVFVVEQKCPYQEVDAIDEQALHTYLTDETGEIIAYTRIYTEGGAVHFGRVLVAKNYRHQGLGKTIVAKTLEAIHEFFPDSPIIIGAQSHLQEFYQQFGFEAISDVYLEDDIPHIDMQK
ncbi:MAG: GNAT family N-acetyltransferase [Enterococcus sp.]